MFCVRSRVKWKIKLNNVIKRIYVCERGGKMSVAAVNIFFLFWKKKYYIRKIHLLSRFDKRTKNEREKEGTIKKFILYPILLPEMHSITASV
jgi:hypothetical protein